MSPFCVRFAVGMLLCPCPAGRVPVGCLLFLLRLFLPGVGYVAVRPVESPRVVVTEVLGRLLVVQTAVCLLLVTFCTVCLVAGRQRIVLACHLGSQWARVVEMAVPVVESLCLRWQVVVLLP